MNSYFEDEDSKEIESYDIKKILKIFGTVFIVAAVIFTVIIFATRSPNQAYEGDFDLSKSDKIELESRATSIVETAGDYGVLGEITKENFMKKREVIYNKYSLDTSDPDLLTRKAIYEQTIGYLFPSSKVEDSYDKLNADEFGLFMSRYTVDNIDVKLPDEGFVDSDGNDSVIVTVSFDSTKTLNVPKDATVTWDGEVEVLQKVDREEIEFTFKKDEDGIWGLDFITKINDPNSLAIIPPRQIDPEDYEVIATYNTGVTREEDEHSQDNTDPQGNGSEPPPGAFDGFDEENGEIILPETPPQS